MIAAFLIFAVGLGGAVALIHYAADLPGWEHRRWRIGQAITIGLLVAAAALLLLLAAAALPTCWEALRS